MRPLNLLPWLLACCLALALPACGDEEASPSSAEAGESETQRGSVEEPTKIVGGVTTLRLDDTLKHVLDVADVHVQGAGAANQTSRAIRFPIRGGNLDIDRPSGELRHAGSLRFEAAGAAVEAKNLVLNADRGFITAEIAGQRVPLLALDMGRPRVPATGDLVVWPGEAGLSDGAAQSIAKRLGVKGLDGGLAFGDVTVSAQRR